MSDTDDISARLCALETVIAQLITHLAIRAEDPPGWVQTRKVLALRAIHDKNPPVAEIGRVRDALLGFFDQAENVAADYSDGIRQGTDRRPGR